MKLKFLYQTIALLGFLFCFTQLDSLEAQTTKYTPKQKAADQQKTSFPYCDEVVASQKVKMQKEANAKCKTVTTCVDCVERKSKIPICAKLTVQPSPKDARCKPVQVQKAVYKTKNGKSRGVAPDMKSEMPFTVDIMQSVCGSGKGTDLMVVVDNQAICSDSKYSIMWEIDGQKAGHDISAKCICGQKAVVHVTNADGDRVSREILLNKCGGVD